MLDDQVTIKIIVLIFFILALYLVLIRPQLKRLFHHQKMQNQLKKGDIVITMGGIIGTIIDFKGENIVIIEAAKGNNLQIFRKMIEGIYKHEI